MNQKDEILANDRPNARLTVTRNKPRRYRCAVCGELVSVTGVTSKEYGSQAIQSCGDRVPWSKVSRGWQIARSLDKEAARLLKIDNPYG